MATVLGIKYFYSGADCGQLLWILAPTAWWVHILSGIPFEYMPDIGYVNHGLRFIIAPSCSGVQFMIIMIAALIFSFVHRMGTMRRGFCWTVLCLGFSYVFTVFVNGIRIIFAIYIPLYFFRPDSGGGWLTPGRLHTSIGVVIYFTSLFAVYQAAGYVSQSIAALTQPLPAPAVSLKNGSSVRPMLRRCLPPVFWYFTIVLGIPLLNRAYRQEWNGFAEYAVLLTAICAALISLFCLISVIKKHI